MNNQLFLSIMYVVSLALPSIGLGKAFWRARQEHKKYENSDREEKRIAEKYRTQTDAVKKRRDAAMEDGSWSRNHTEILAAENALKEKIRLEEEAHGVDRITYKRLEDAMSDLLRNYPKRNYLLRIDEVIFVGVGIIVSTTASIWSLWV